MTAKTDTSSFYLELRVNISHIASCQPYESAGDAAQVGHDILRTIKDAGFPADKLAFAILSELPPTINRAF